ncbi:MAG: hypothetical protein IPK83_11555 [Planctomycetes bacterium]|nr:hypothetical protein [Planctomycetota bacterium]
MATNMPQDGGPIYPCNAPINKGMSLRDWLAGQALAGFTRVRDAEMFNEHTTRWYARVAYALADAMLVERAEREEKATDEMPQHATFRGDIPDIAVTTPWPVGMGAH